MFSFFLTDFSFFDNSLTGPTRQKFMSFCLCNKTALWGIWTYMTLSENNSSALNKKHEEQHKVWTKIFHCQLLQQICHCELESYWLGWASSGRVLFTGDESYASRQLPRNSCPKHKVCLALKLSPTKLQQLHLYSKKIPHTQSKCSITVFALWVAWRTDNLYQCTKATQMLVHLK